MINNGKFELIEIDSLKTAIIDLYRNYKSIGQQIIEFNMYSSDLLIEWSKTNTDIKYTTNLSKLFDEPRMFNKNDWSWINEPESYKFNIAEETIGVYTNKYNLFVEYFIQLLENVTDVLQLIRDELGED